MPGAPLSRPRQLTLVLALVGGLLLVPALSLAAARKLNDTLALGGRIEAVDRVPLRPGYQISPDSSTAVFLADQSTAGVFELYSVPLGGGTPVKLNGPLAPGGNVVEFAIDSASQRVVYLADQREDATFELYSVPLGGGTPVTLNSFLTAGGDVERFAISPDASTVVFLADRNDAEVLDLFATPIAGGAPDVRLNNRPDPSNPVGDVQGDFAITGDNQRVIFRHDSRQAGTFGLFSAPLTGGAPADDITIGEIGAPDSYSALDFVITPNNARVVFRVFDPFLGSLDLGLSPVAGPTFFLNRLTEFGTGLGVELPPFDEVPDGREGPDPLPYAVTADSAFVILIADGTTDNLYELWRVPITDDPGAATPVSLTDSLPADADVAAFAINSAGDRVVYKSDRALDNVYGLHSVRVSGLDTFQLVMPTAFDGDVFRFALSPDGSRVVFRSNFSDAASYELRSVPVDGSAGSIVLNGALAPGGDVDRFAITPNSQRVIYTADQDINGRVEVYSVLLGGGTATRLNEALVNGGDVEDFVISPNTSRVIFRADTSTDEVFNLVSVPTVGGSGVTLTNTASVSGDVEEHQVSPSGSHTVYLADQETDEVYELFARSLNTGSFLVKLNGTLGADGDVHAYQIDPTGQRVVYIADQDTGDVDELYSVPIDGGPVLKLNPPLVAGGDVQEFQISSDGMRVIYIANQSDDELYDLYSVPILGGTAVKLSSLPFGGYVEEFAISPNSQRVIYIADQSSDDEFELFSVAIGGGSPTTLNGLLPAGGDVYSFEISPNSQRVVYISDQNTAGVAEIYSVALTGGTPQRLNPPLLAGRSVDPGDVCAGQRGTWSVQPNRGFTSFLISPNSQRVVYCADQDADDVVELYSVPINGTAAAVKLNVPPGNGGFVSNFEISSDSTRVVFETLAVVAGLPQERLSSALLGGGSQPILLNGPVEPFSEVDEFAITPDNGLVVFINDRDAPEQFELYATLIGGGTPSKRSGALVAGGDVRNFTVSADSTRVVYRADALSDGVSELFSNLLIGDSDPLVISDPLATNGDVRSDFLLRRSDEGVVYRADQLIDNVIELFETRFDVSAPEAVRVAFAGDLIVDEDDGTAQLVVSLNQALTTRVTVGFGVTGGTASGAGVDFVVLPGTLTFEPGEVSKTIAVTLVDDDLAEFPETVVLTLASPSGAVLGSKPSATLTIRDDDGPPANGVYLPMIRQR